ncbi:MAG: FAD-dependent oxidoreductase, partial [Pseudomonadota bacterium]
MTQAPSETGQKRKLKADLIVIGGGSGGLSAAAGAAMLGLNVVLYEKAEMGGDCLNYGCVPSKALLTTAKYAQTAREGEKYGVTTSAPVVDWGNCINRFAHMGFDFFPVDNRRACRDAI